MRCARIFPALLLSLTCLLSTGALAGLTPLVSDANPDANDGVAQYGQFVGTWTCVPTSRQEDGSQKESEARPTWVWHYVLNGRAVQDVWIPDPEHSPQGAIMGTNLRVYDPDKDTWVMVWATETLGRFLTFTAKMRDGEIVMHGDIAEGQFPAHLARITFHNISDDHFDWKYEASASGDGKTWSLHSTLSCDRSA